MSHYEQNMLYQHMPDYQPLHHYEHFNFYSTSYETTSCLLPANTTPNTTHNSSKIFVNMTYAVHLTPWEWN